MKISVIGAGNVGATCANVIATYDIVKEVVLLDIKEGIAEASSRGVDFMMLRVCRVMAHGS